MSLQKLRCGVVGVGYLGRFHAQKYQQIPGAELVGVFDANSSRAQDVANELGTSVFKSIDDFLGKVDAVSIAASTGAHFELSQHFLKNGIHCLVEKPITTASKDGLVLVDLAEKKKLKLQVGHVERFNPAFKAVREKLRKPLFMECHRLAPFKPRSIEVDVVFDLMIHDLDVILSLDPSEIVNIQAVGVPVLTKFVDIANARIEFASGLVTNVTASRVSLKAERKMRIFQEDQYISVDFGSGSVNLTRKTGNNWEDGNIPLDTESWSLEKADALKSEIESFVQSITQNTPCVVTGTDGMRAVELAEKIVAKINRT